MNLLCEILSIQYPIIQGGMGNISSPLLAGAVSEAGGLGTIGCGTSSAEEVEKKIIELKNLTDKPFAVNIALTVTPHIKELIQLVIQHKVPVVSLSAGNPQPYIKRLHEEGIKVIVIIASVKHAEKAQDAGADVLVAEGFEAAGINSNFELTTMTLIPQIAAKVKVPLAAAGGIGDGGGLAAALSLGASGVQMGTRLIATKEMAVHELYKERLVNAADTETIIIGRAVGRVRRVLKGAYTNRLFEKEKGMTLEQFNAATTEDEHISGAVKGDSENGFLNSGQIAGLIEDIPSVAELFERMIQEAEESLERAKEQLSSAT